MKTIPEDPIHFQEKHIPAASQLAGLSFLVQAFQIQAPVRNPACISSKRLKESVRKVNEWHVFDNKYALAPNAINHLVFALRHENLDLLVLKRIFQALPEAEIVSYVNSAPTGPVARRVWFFYEFLTGKKLKIADCGKVAVVDLLDQNKYFASEGVVSKRHKVRNNLLGTANFCPIIRKSEKLDAYILRQLSGRAKATLEKMPAALIARAASFLLLADSQASFAIEGERLPRNREERWLRAVHQAGKHTLSVEELNRLHDILIEDNRFVSRGFRKEGVFLGQRTADGDPLPEFIGARHSDIDELITGLLDADAIMQASPLDAVLQATAIAFGFVYIHPYEDGNGRLHRLLIHHALGEKKFSPQGLVLPVSSIMLKRIDDYRLILEAHSGPLMPYIEWTASERGNVSVLNDTSDLYRYFDCTEAAEFLYQCVEETIEKDVPEELDYLKRHDQAIKRLMDKVEMPDRIAEEFIMFMRQNDWKLPKKRREQEFAKLTDEEVKALEEIVQDAFAA